MKLAILFLFLGMVATGYANAIMEKVAGEEETAGEEPVLAAVEATDSDLEPAEFLFGGWGRRGYGGWGRGYGGFGRGYGGYGGWGRGYGGYGGWGRGYGGWGRGYGGYGGYWG
ncbi:unnamed protein product [Cyprideis torosa]|uniref:Uncharacterized protein n=1 Tax=Cyprideis torosa TaxID=163714 RepID=A0A7R8WKV1_9CRUS|nr:unnamed protein product [Cyprideis torosa]CAG0897383.1 unnamed protein product [Cyprideis torosa]